MSLERFLQAQEEGGSYERALVELKAGQKTGHWIWWVFPQLKGLGSSHNSTYYGLADEAEARAYIQHAVLGQRYCDCVKVLYAQFFVNRKTAIELMGSQIDVIKLRSSLELFMRHARHAHDIPGRIMMLVKIEMILKEKLDWNDSAKNTES
jgi:uncharacterized protein (DUF1810 family)